MVVRPPKKHESRTKARSGHEHMNARRKIGTPTNGAVILSVSGPAVKNLTIYASPDLLNWLPIVTKTNAQGTLQYTDTAAGSFTRRFYKATAE